MNLKVLFFSFVGLALNSCIVESTRLAPAYIHPCEDTSTECLMKATQEALPEFVKGIPELGIPTLDPFIIEKLPIQLQGITVTFYKGKVSGFRTCIIDNVEAQLERRHFVLDFHCNITVKGLYEAKGKLLLFPIDGAGDAKVELTNLRVKVDVKTKYVQDDQGLTYWGIRNYTYSYDYGDKVHFDIKNLFKESKELSKKVLAYLNENWRVLTDELGTPIMDYAIDLAIKTVMKFFRAIPYESLLLVPLPSVILE